MQRQALLSVAAVLIFSAAGALAQDGDLARVTMRVLDDVSGVDAVVLELDANRGEGEEGAAGDEGAEGGNAAEADERGREAADRDTDEDARRAERRERDELHDVAVDERSESRLEDNDVERPTVSAPTVP